MMLLKVKSECPSQGNTKQVNRDTAELEEDG